MDFNNYEEKFRILAIDSGYSEDNIIKCLHYAKPLFTNGYPIIYNSAHLASLVGYKRSYIKRATIFSKFFYRDFTIFKKNGQLRQISEPLPSLKDIQYWILENILYNAPVSKFAKAYIPEKTLIDNLKFHRNKEKIMCVDIKDFFTSIKQEQVFSIFKKIGYSTRVSITLSNLCCLNKSLPQGAPTSPQLSNIYMLDFDEKISKYCIEKGIRYTRYADDLTFSGKFNENELLKVVNEIFDKELVINSEKTKVMLSNTRQIVTGVVVNKKLQVPKEKRKEIRQNIYYIEKFGLYSHLAKIQCSKSNYLRHLLGLVNYVLFINPEDKEAKAQKDFLHKLIEYKPTNNVYIKK